MLKLPALPDTATEARPLHREAVGHPQRHRPGAARRRRPLHGDLRRLHRHHPAWRGTADRPRRHRAGWTLNIPGAEAEPTGQQDTQPPSEDQPERPADPKDEQQQPVDQPAESERPADPETEAPEVRQPQAEEPTAAADVEGRRGPDEADEADDSILDAPWILAGLTGGGVLLSAALFMAVQTRRRAQFRNRRPGRAVAAPAPELAPVEMTMTATGAAAAATVEFTHEALRRLADTVGTSGGTMPPLAAVELGHGKLTLHLSAADRAARPLDRQSRPDPLARRAPTSTSMSSAPTPGTSRRPTRSW